MSQLKTKRMRSLLLSLCVVTAPTAAWGNPTRQPSQQAHLGEAVERTSESFVLPTPDAIRPRNVPQIQSNFCGGLAGGVGAGAASIGAQIIAVLAVVGWCGSTLTGADETIRGDLEKGLMMTAVATVLGGLVGWGAGYGLALNNEVPENQFPLWEWGGASIGAGSSIAVGLGALGIRMLLPPPAAPEPVAQTPTKRERRKRPKPRSR